MTLNAAVAFSFLKDCFKYSIKNNWIDENGDIYFIFTNQELGETLKVKSKQTVVKIKKELEAYGLLEQKRMGVNRPNRLYLLQPEVTVTDVYEIQYIEAEPPNPLSIAEVQEMNFQREYLNPLPAAEVHFLDTINIKNLLKILRRYKMILN